MGRNLQNELSSAERRLEEIETRREILCREHVSAVDACRRAWQDGDTDKEIASRNDRLTKVQAALTGADDAAHAIRNEVARLRAECETAADRAQREAKAKSIEAKLPPIQKSFEEAKAALENFADACSQASADVIEAGAIHDYAKQFVDVTSAEMPRLNELFGARIREALTIAKPAQQPQPVPTLVPQPHRAHDVVQERFVDFTDQRADARR